MSANRPNCVVLNPRDNVAVALSAVAEGDALDSVTVAAREAVPSGHKVAIRNIAKGEEIVKYGEVIGYADCPIEKGCHVHVHNIHIEERHRIYEPGKKVKSTEYVPAAKRRTFEGYVRKNGKVGTRNYVGIIASVSCSGDVATFIADVVEKKLLPDFPGVDGVVALGHGSGCCMAPGGEGLSILQRTIQGYAENPNFGGVLLLGLGCEVNLVESLMEDSGLEATDTVKCLTIQQAGGTEATIEQGLHAIHSMLPAINRISRQTVSVEHLTVGLECGGSDAYSGITANPALGAAVDLLVSNGGTAILSETTEIYGAEHLLVERALSKRVGDRLVERIRWWEEYTRKNDAQINNNPTPGNKAGGISTILEKSMGAVAKAGSTNLNAVYRYAEQVNEKGLVFMDTPGYDVVSITGMIAGGANLVCFTTGRGTVCGFRPVPTIKLATNTAMYEWMAGDMDINCGRIIDGELDIREAGAEIFEEMILTASGKKTKSEQLGFGGHEFVPWHMGAVL